MSIVHYYTLIWKRLSKECLSVKIFSELTVSALFLRSHHFICYWGTCRKLLCQENVFSKIKFFKCICETIIRLNFLGLKSSHQIYDNCFETCGVLALSSLSSFPGHQHQQSEGLHCSSIFTADHSSNSCFHNGWADPSRCPNSSAEFPIRILCLTLIFPLQSILILTLLRHLPYFLSFPLSALILVFKEAAMLFRWCLLTFIKKYWKQVISPNWFMFFFFF